MADDSIDIIYEEIRTVLLGLKFKEAKMYFDFDNIPDSMLDNTFIISPVALDPGDLDTPDNRLPIFNLKAKFKINLSVKLSANNVIQKMKSASLNIENIIKGILAIVCGEDEKDKIEFTGSDFEVNEGTDIIYEINFDLNYRIKNI